MAQARGLECGNARQVRKKRVELSKDLARHALIKSAGPPVSSVWKGERLGLGDQIDQRRALVLRCQ